MYFCLTFVYPISFSATCVFFFLSFCVFSPLSLQDKFPQLLSLLQETTSSGNFSLGRARSTSPTRWPSCTTTACASSAATTASGTPARPTSPCIGTRTGSSSPTRPTWPSSAGCVELRRPARKRHYGLCSKAF